MHSHLEIKSLHNIAFAVPLPSPGRKSRRLAHCWRISVLLFHLHSGCCSCSGPLIGIIFISTHPEPMAETSLAFVKFTQRFCKMYFVVFLFTAICEAHVEQTLGNNLSVLYQQCQAFFRKNSAFSPIDIYTAPHVPLNLNSETSIKSTNECTILYPLCMDIFERPCAWILTSENPTSQTLKPRP